MPRSLRLASLLTFLLLLGALATAMDQATASPQRMDSDLDLVHQLAAPNELIPITIVMEEQANAVGLLPIAQSLPRHERRAFATTELKQIAARSQARVLDFLAAAQARGEAGNVRSLWIANGIAARVTPATIDALLGFDEIRILLWDPTLPPGQAEDVIPGASDGAGASAPAAVGDGAATSAIWWQLDYVHAPEVWALGYRGDGIVVAVTDSGIDRTHPDLSSHMWNNVDEIPGNSIDDDNNGFVDDTWGWDFEFNDNNPMPGISHGTNCAGIVAGDGTQGTSTGVAPGALLMALKVNTWSQNIAGIQYAIDNGADIISMSRSEKWRFVPKPNYDWWRANTDNELLVGIFHANSIGNEGDNQNTDPIPFNIAAPGCCPAPWRHPDQVQAGVSGIIGCGAVDQANNIASYSSRGPFAWEDIHAHWPEYPYSMRPEYQDYPWWGGQPGLLKPDIVAPGPNTRSTQPGGGYITFSGTSAATPHIAGAMALCLQANPSLTPEQMAMILQTTAGDLGATGKDNTFGAGKLNCLGAVQAALSLSNVGTVAGTVTDSGNQSPIAGVLVEVIGEAESAITDANGHYEITLAAETYTLRFTEFYHVVQTAQVTITAQTITTLDMALDLRPAGNIAGTVVIEGGATPIAGAVMAVLDTPVGQTTTGGTGDYGFSGVPAATYSVSATKFGYEPSTLPVIVLANATADLDFALTPAVVALDLETDPSWQVGVPGDNASGGIWVRVDPVGTAAQPENDHTLDPGVLCFVTGQGLPGGAIDAADVDGGRTTLRTGPMDLSGFSGASVNYWRWYSNNLGPATDDQWVVQISSDGGANWVDLERTGVASAAWTYHEFVISDYVNLTSQMMVQFIASDLGGVSVVEAGVDDFQVFANAGTTAVDDAASSGAVLKHIELGQNHPNPFHPATTIRLALPGGGPVDLAIYDVTGRLVRNLVTGPLAAGEHAVEWNGRDERGLTVPAGIYLYRLTANGTTVTRRMVMLK